MLYSVAPIVQGGHFHTNQYREQGLKFSLHQNHFHCENYFFLYLSGKVVSPMKNVLFYLNKKYEFVQKRVVWCVAPY